MTQEQIDLLKKFYLLMLVKSCGTVNGKGEPVFYKDGRGSGTVKHALEVAIDLGIVDPSQVIG